MRSAKNQSKHDALVEIIANTMLNDCWEVAAALKGWPNWPPNLNGSEPDVYGWKDGYELVVEVETPDSMNTMEALIQKAAFEQWRAENPSCREVRIDVTD